METITSIFESRAAGERAFADLAKSADFDRENLLLLTADGAAEKIDTIPSDEGEQPGMGSAIGGVVGGAVGLAAGAVLSNLVLPGVGPILTLGLERRRRPWRRGDRRRRRKRRGTSAIEWSAQR